MEPRRYKILKLTIAENGHWLLILKDHPTEALELNSLLCLSGDPSKHPLPAQYLRTTSACLSESEDQNNTIVQFWYHDENLIMKTAEMVAKHLGLVLEM